MDNSEVFHDAFIKMIDFAKEHLSKERFNEFVYALYTYGIENVSIEEVPVYENVEWNGCVLWKHIKGMDYKIDVKLNPMYYRKKSDKKCEHYTEDDNKEKEYEEYMRTHRW